MEKDLNNLKDKIKNIDKFMIYGAGDFASLLVRYCSINGFADKIKNCIVSKRDLYTPAHILGVPVIELEQIEWITDGFIVIAVLSERWKGEIKESLEKLRFYNLYFMKDEEFRALYEVLGDFSIGIQSELRRLTKQLALQNEWYQQKYRDLSVLIQSMQTVSEIHKQSFGKYKNINKGKVVVICAPGPSLNKYNYNDTYVHIGLNSLLFNDKIKMDYYFNQHLSLNCDFWNMGEDVCPDIRKKYLDFFPKLKCVKFIGQRIGTDWPISPPIGEVSDSNYNCYYTSNIEYTHRFCVDIRYSLLYGSTSIIFPALQFALFTNPEKILIVGSDGYSLLGENYFREDIDNDMKERAGNNLENMLPSVNERMERIYKEFYKFALVSYPNTEIIMVNPVHFKGIFKETITDESGKILL